MAVSYKGLTIKFGGDTSELQSALKKIQTETRNTQSDLKAINKALEFNPGKTELLEQKVRNLNAAYDETKRKLDAYKQAMQQLEDKKQRGEQLTEEEQRQYDALQREIYKCENQLKTYTDQLKSANTEMEASQTALYQFGQTLENNSKMFSNIGEGMQQVGSGLTRYVTTPLVGIGVAAGKTAVDIDTAMTGVRKTVAATEEEYEALKDAAIAYSETNAISAVDILNAEELAGQLGVSKDNLFEFAKVATGLDLSTDMNVDQASTNLARFANITSMSTLTGEDAARAYQAYGNTIVGLGNNCATTESEISDFSLRMASAASQAGMSEADILGIAAAMSSLGLEAASGGSAFSKTISDISVAVATGSDDLVKYAEVAGMSAEDFARYWQEDATGAFEQFIIGLSTSSDDMNVVLEDLGITELRQSDALRRLAGNTDLLTDSVQLANEEWENGTALSDEVANKNDSMASKFEMLRNKVTGILEKIGGPLVDALTDAIDAAEPFLNTIKDLAQGFADMDQDQQRMILGLVGAAAAFGPVLSGAGSLISNLGSVGTKLKEVSIGWESFTGFLTANPIMLGVAAVAAAAAGLTWFFTQTETGKQMWADFTSWISEKWQAVQDFFAGVPEFWSGIWDNVTGAVDTAKTTLETAWTGLQTAATEHFDAIKQTISDDMAAAQEAGSHASSALQAAMSGDWSTAQAEAIACFDTIKTRVGERMDALKSAVTGIVDSIGAALGFPGLSSKIAGVFDSIRNTIRDKINAAKDAVTGAIDRIKGAFNFHISWPHIPLPHFNWHMQSIGGILSLPHFDGISWYARGNGVFDPNHPQLIGVGDNKYEREYLNTESQLRNVVEAAVRNAGGAGGVSVNVNVNANITGRTSAYEIGQEIGRGVQSTLKQRGRVGAYA